MVVGGYFAALPVFHLTDWLTPATLSVDDLCLWGEIFAGWRVRDGSVMNLTTDEWLERWRAFSAAQASQGKSEGSAR